MKRINTITQITSFRVTRASDGHETAYCQWIDTAGNHGSTVGNARGTHMGQLAMRAGREGAPMFIPSTPGMSNEAYALRFTDA